jgi:hypothetical protein
MDFNLESRGKNQETRQNFVVLSNPISIQIP